MDDSCSLGEEHSLTDDFGVNIVVDEFDDDSFSCSSSVAKGDKQSGEVKPQVMDICLAVKTQNERNGLCQDSHTNDRNNRRTFSENCGESALIADSNKRTMNQTLEAVDVITPASDLIPTPITPFSIGLTPFSVEPSQPDLNTGERRFLCNKTSLQDCTRRPKPRQNGISRGVLILGAIVVVVVCIFGYNLLDFRRQPVNKGAKNPERKRGREPDPRRI
jgi:hypothetical protein